MTPARMPPMSHVPRSLRHDVDQSLLVAPPAALLNGRILTCGGPAGVFLATGVCPDASVPTADDAGAWCAPAGRDLSGLGTIYGTGGEEHEAIRPTSTPAAARGAALVTTHLNPTHRVWIREKEKRR
jgi:hypothetical protein